MNFGDKEAYVMKVAENISLTFSDNVGLIPEGINSLGRALHPALYIILQCILLKSENGKQLKIKEKVIYNWLLNFTKIHTLFLLSLLMTVVFSYFLSKDYNYDFLNQLPLFLTVTFFFLMSFYLFWNQKTLQKLKYYSPHTIIDIDENISLSLKDISKIFYSKKYFKNNSDLQGIADNIFRYQKKY